MLREGSIKTIKRSTAKLREALEDLKMENGREITDLVVRGNIRSINWYLDCMIHACRKLEAAQSERAMKSEALFIYEQTASMPRYTRYYFSGKESPWDYEHVSAPMSIIGAARKKLLPLLTEHTSGVTVENNHVAAKIAAGAVTAAFLIGAVNEKVSFTLFGVSLLLSMACGETYSSIQNHERLIAAQRNAFRGFERH